MGRSLWLLLLAWLLLPCHVLASESTPVVTARTTATLVATADPNQPGTLRVALRLRIAPGWHTYWKNPGDAGAPPELTLNLPEGVTAGPIEWAAPARMPEGTLMTYGYAGEVLFPVRLTSPGSLDRIEAEATWLVCKDICVPEEGRFTLDALTGSSNEDALFAAHDRLVPRPAPWTTRLAPDGRLGVAGPELNPGTVHEAWFIPDRPDAIRHDAPQALSVGSDGFTLGLALLNPPAGPALTGVLSIRDPTGRVAAFTIAATPGPVASSNTPLLQVLGFALLGGLILNLMPCVFPVLAMKAMALARGAATRQVRAHALSYTTGVLVSFAALGFALVAGRSAGLAMGWGFQFQSPVFLVAMTWLMVVIGLNLSGVFQIGGRIAGTGATLAAKGGHAGSFFTGLLAVLVATPCTAPFMGSALAAGLAAPPAVTLAVFLALGLGLAAPYTMLAIWPALGHRFPRPGPWMERLRQLLAFPMYGTAVWLLWVVSQSAGPDGVLVAGAGAVALALGAWAFGTTQAGAGLARGVGRAALILAMGAAMALLFGLDSAPPATSSSNRADAYSAERLSELRQQGRPVFVNMTAAWCVTCLVNERIALRTDAVVQAFTASGITYLKGDWTRQDPAITAYLRDFNRDGVPLYVFYPAGGLPPVVLPQILTESIVLRAIGS